MERQGVPKVGAGVLALATALVAQAAPAAPACTAAAPEASWAECAGVSSVGGEGTLAASLDFATLSYNDHPASPTSIDAAQPEAAIPEPHTNLLMLAGLAALGFMTMRRRRQ